MTSQWKKHLLNPQYESSKTDFTSLGQNEGTSDILARGKYLVGVPSFQTKAKTRFVERVSQVYELFHSIFNFTTQSVN